MEIVILLVAITAQLVIGFFTFFYNRSSHLHRLFLLLALSAAIWGVTNFLSLHQDTPAQTLNYIRFNLMSGMWWASVLFLIVHTFPELKLHLKTWKLVAILVAIVVISILTRTSLIFSSIEGIGAGASPIPGPAIPLYGITTAFFIIGSLVMLIRRYRHARGKERIQLQYLMLGLMLSAVLTFIGNFIFVIIFKINSFIVLGPLFLLPSIGFTAYAIVAHQLFDIRVIIRKTVEYSGLLLFTLVIYSMVIYFFSTIFGGGDVFNTRNFASNLIAALLIAIGFDPLRRFLARITDKFLFKGEYDQQAVLTDLSQKLSDSVDLNEAMQSLVSIIKSQLRLTHAAVITFTTDEKQVMIKNIAQDGYTDTSILQLRPENGLVLQFAHQPQVLVTEFLRQQCKTETVPNEWKQVCQFLLVDLDKLHIAIAIPILVNKKAIGMFLVGEKLSGDIYNRNEISFLEIVANQTANAIEKARFWEEDQMKSEFVSIASHELLTPTAAMKGYLSMILDDNMGQVDDTARRYLTKVAQSSDRLAQLVEELLNVSRIESGRIKVTKREFSLSELAQKSVGELQVNAQNKSLDLAFVPPRQSVAECVC